MKKFRLDRSHGKFLGVCAGIAEYTGLDATIVRIALVVLTIAGGWPWTCIGYVAAAWAAKASHRESVAIDRRPASGSIHDLSHGLTDTDHRLAEIERYVASPNSRLASEIDALR